MSEATTVCTHCGNQIAPDAAACPHCGASLAAAAAPDAPAQQDSVGGIQAALSALLATTKTHKWYWVGGGGGALVVAVLAVLFFAGVFGPGGKAICVASLQQAKDFGVISPSATLASNSAESTDVAGRKKCTASADSDSYVLQADVKDEDAAHKKCTDYAKQADCLKLYSVARSDGMTTYQVREIPPDETDAAILAGEGQAGAAPPAAGGGNAASDAGGFDAPTSVDNGGNPQAAPDQEQAPPQQ